MSNTTWMGRNGRTEVKNYLIFVSHDGWTLFHFLCAISLADTSWKTIPTPCGKAPRRVPTKCRTPISYVTFTGGYKTSSYEEPVCFERFSAFTPWWLNLSPKYLLNPMSRLCLKAYAHIEHIRIVVEELPLSHSPTHTRQVPMMWSMFCFKRFSALACFHTR